jgi:hypothetical protein
MTVPYVIGYGSNAVALNLLDLLTFTDANWLEMSDRKEFW